MRRSTAFNVQAKIDGTGHNTAEPTPIIRPSYGTALDRAKTSAEAYPALWQAKHESTHKHTRSHTSKKYLAHGAKGALK